MDKLTYEECKPFLPLIPEAKVLRVYDGDTLHLGAFLPPPYLATRFCARLIGIDTPELRSTDEAEKALAKEAREELKSLVLNKVVNIVVAGHDKYGRLLVRASNATIPDLSTHLIDVKLGVQYDGTRKRKTNWTLQLNERAEFKSSLIKSRNPNNN